MAGRSTHAHIVRQQGSEDHGAFMRHKVSDRVASCFTPSGSDKACSGIHCTCHGLSILSQFDHGVRCSECKLGIA